jgi:hypothetical protein
MANDTLRVVVDASVAMAAGTSVHPTSKNCRECLEVVADKNGSHFIVMSKAIEEEWKDADPDKPGCKTSARWLRRLYSNRKVFWVEDDSVFDSELRDLLDQLESDKHIRLAMLEDIHLIEAANATDRIVLSLDQVRRHFHKWSSHTPKLADVMWCDPGKDDTVQDWLRAGCTTDDERRLGYVSPVDPTTR